MNYLKIYLNNLLLDLQNMHERLNITLQNKRVRSFNLEIVAQFPQIAHHNTHILVF